MNDYLPDSSWISVATFEDIGSATACSDLLNSAGIPASTSSPLRAALPVDVLVAPDRAEEARQILSQPSPDDELTQEALAESPVDDGPEEASTGFSDREQHVTDLGPLPYERQSSGRRPWLYAVLGTAVAVVLLK